MFQIETLLVLLIVAVAGGYLLRRLVRAVRGRSCGACHGCARSAGDEPCDTSIVTTINLAPPDGRR